MTEVTTTVKPPGMLEKFSGRVNDFMESKFYALGFRVGTHPKKTIGLCLFGIMLCAAGMVNYKAEGRPEKLWVPSDTRAESDAAKYDKLFGQGTRISMLLIKAHGADVPAAGILDATYLQKAMALYDEIHNISFTRAGELINQEALCIPSYPYPCLVSSVLSKWDFSPSTLRADADPLATINDGDSAASLSEMLGDVDTDAATGAVTSARALTVTFLHQKRDELVEGDWEDPINDMWEEKLLKLAERYADGKDGLRVYRFATRSFSDEFGAVITADISLISASYFLVLIYVVLNFAERKRANSRGMLALAVISMVGGSIGCSYGLASAFGYATTPLTSVLPFVLLGLGVDDAFVILGAFAQTPTGEPVNRRLATALGRAGVSITITSVTDFVAFAISTSTSLPALASFCAFGMFGILALYVLSATFFGAALALDQQRIDAGLADGLPCCTCLPCSPCQPNHDPDAGCGGGGGGGAIESQPDEKKTDAKMQETAEEGVVVAVAPAAVVAHDNQGEGRVGRFLQQTYAPLLLHPAAKAGVLVGFVAMLVVCALGAAKLSVESSTNSFLPDGSYVLEFINANNRYFGSNGEDVALVLGRGHFEHRAEALALGPSLRGSEHSPPYVRNTSGATFDSWVEEYVRWTDAACYGACPALATDELGPTDEAEWYAYAGRFLNGAGARYNASVVWEGAHGGPAGIRGSKVSAQHTSFAKWSTQSDRLQEDTAKQTDAMDTLRRKLDGLSLSAFPWCSAYSTWETYKIIYEELMTNVLLCLGAVGIITLISVAHPVPSFLVTLVVAMVVVDILGCMYFWGLVVDNVAVIYIVLAVGLSVDYSAHVAHNFMTKAGASADERVAATLGDIGGAVMNGAASTFLAVLLLSNSKSYVFVVMFKEFLLTAVLGVGHGLILLPVLLSLVGPPPFAHGGHGAEEGHGGPTAVGGAGVDVELVDAAPAEVLG